MNNKVTKSLINEKGKQIGNYLLKEPLGRGKFGMVFKALHLKTNQIFAAKQLKKASIVDNPHHKRLFMTEVTIMNTIKHPNILHLSDFLESEQNYYLIVNYCNQGNLQDFLNKTPEKRFGEFQAVRYLKQIANAFVEMRKRKILHRDLKLDNIFLNDDNVVIGDFGFAKMGQEYAESKLGTPITMAYELLTANPKNCIYNSLADLWSIGVIFYQMLFGRFPFNGKNMADYIRCIEINANGNLDFPFRVSKESRDLLSRILVTDPKKRMEWKAFFEHDLFKKNSARISIDFSNRNLAERKKSPQTIEFIKNGKDISNYRKTNFLDKTGILETYKNKIIKPKSIINTVEMDITQSSVQTPFVKFKKRVDHEKHFLEFFISTFKKLRHCLNINVFPAFKCNLYNFSVLILEKAKINAESAIDQLKQKRNLFGIEDHAFVEITNTIEYKEILADFESKRTKIVNYIKYIFQKANEEKIMIDAFNSFLSKAAVINDINRLFVRRYNEVKSLYTTNSNFNNESRKYFSFIISLIKCCMNSESVFSFYGSKGNRKGFDWETFYKQIENIQNAN